MNLNINSMKGMKDRTHSIKIKSSCADLIKNQRGLSLVEIIIVIAIMAVLIGILTPSFLAYVEKSRKTVCLKDIDTLQREYIAAAIHANPRSLAEAKVLLESVIVCHGGGYEGESDTSIHDASSTGICKSHGKYQCNIDHSSLLTVNIICDKHGMLTLDVVRLKEILDAVKLTQGPYATIGDYFQNGRTTIDSEAISTGGYGEYGSLAKIIESTLNEQGINIHGRSWRLYKSGGNYTLTLAEKKILPEDEGKYVFCERYNIATNKVEKGYVKVVMMQQSEGKKYPVFDGSSFCTELP